MGWMSTDYSDLTAKDIEQRAKNQTENSSNYPSGVAVLELFFLNNFSINNFGVFAAFPPHAHDADDDDDCGDVEQAVDDPSGEFDSEPDEPNTDDDGGDDEYNT